MYEYYKEKLYVNHFWELKGPPNSVTIQFVGIIMLITSGSWRDPLTQLQYSL